MLQVKLVTDFQFQSERKIVDSII